MLANERHTRFVVLPHITHRFVSVDDLRVFYRDTGPDDATPLPLRGFPSGSHLFRRLFDALGSRFRLIAPDYPGFGHSDRPVGPLLDRFSAR